jgi:hypothetical protein
MRSWRRSLLGAAALAPLIACRRPPPASSETTVDAGSSAPEAPASAQPAPVVGRPRCRTTEWSASFLDGGANGDLELGDAIPFGGGVAVAVVLRGAADRSAGIVLARPDGDGPARVFALGPTLGDAPPPRLAARAGELLAVFHGAPPLRRHAGGARDESARMLVLDAIAADGSAAPLFSVEEQRDDSLAADIACLGDRGLVVWDEATSEPRGVIRAAPFVGRQRVGPTLDLSPKESDAELPRVVSLGKGFAVVWIARGPETTAGAPDGSDFEATGEPRTRGWLEMIPLDELGAPTGPVRRLTPPTGHVTAFDIRVASPAGASLVLVVARDDGESVDGSGGTLLRVRVTPDSAEPPVAFATDGLGRGAPTLVDGDPLWLAWVGPGEQVRLLPLDAAGAPGGLPGPEDGMDEARPVLALGSGRLLVETPADAAGQLRIFACSR